MHSVCGCGCAHACTSVHMVCVGGWYGVTISGSDAHCPSQDEGEGEMSPDDRAVFVQRHSVPVDDYDSMDEDRILATMARV